MNTSALCLLPAFLCMITVDATAQSTIDRNDAVACQPPLIVPQGSLGSSADISYAIHAPPQYPLAMNVLGFGGTMMLLVVVNDCGKVVDMHIERTTRLRLLDKAAADAVRGWVFNPGMKDGQRVGGMVRVPLNFSPTWMLREYSSDSESFPYPTVEAAWTAINALPGVESVRRSDGITYYVSYAQNGPTIWEYFAAPNPLGPAVVRLRFLNWTTLNRPPSTAHIQISYRCEASISACVILAADVQDLVAPPLMPTATMPLSPLVPQPPPPTLPPTTRPPTSIPLPPPPPPPEQH